MEIPKYIDNMIEQRANSAERFNHYDYELSEWLEKNNVITESCDTRGGVEAIVNPYASASRIRQAIREAGKYNGRNR